MEALPVDHLKRVAREAFAGSAVLAAYVHGSRVVGTPHPASDLDIGYYPRGRDQGDGLSIREEMIFEAELSDRLGVQVDLRNLAEAPLEVRGRALEEGIRIYSADDVERVALERTLLGRYHDYKEEFRRMHEIRLRRTAEKGL